MNPWAFLNYWGHVSGLSPQFYAYDHCVVVIL